MEIESLTSTSQSLKTLNSLTLYQSSLSSLSIPNQIPPNQLSSFPPSKHIPKTHFLIDAFRSSATAATTAYFLTHFHSDHYSGITSNWSRGIIFCSHITANLLIHILNVPSQFVYPLNLNETVIIDGSEVTLIDANHCPGAVQFLFRVKSFGGIEMYVHTGDFRYCSDMKEARVLREFVGCDAVFLDTTYCNPKFVFPKQDESIDYIVGVIERIGGGEFREKSSKSVLFLVATYVVGKERILIEIAKRCRRKVFIDGRKMKVLSVLGYGDCGVFTEDATETDVHVVGWNVLGETWPYFRPNFVNIKEVMVERGYSRVVGFVPTGWTYEVKRNKFSVRSKDSFEIHLVPYSEHSNYDELREYVKFLRPKRVIPTVGMDTENLDSKHVVKMQKHFAGLVDEIANKKQFLKGFHRQFSENAEKFDMEDVHDLSEGLNQEKEVKLNEEKAIEDKDSGVVLNSSVLEESGSQTLTTMNDEEAENIILELHEFLPLWVTRDQMLDLIGISGGNLVDAVSIFHERETEFHQQVFDSTTAVPSSQTGSINESELSSEPLSIRNSEQIISTPSSQNFISLRSCSNLSIKSSMSPGKKKRVVENKRSKKVKTKSKPETSGQKQSTITSFFTKTASSVSQGSVARLCPKLSPVDKDTLPNEDRPVYEDEIEQFIRIIGGSEASRGYATTILERTKGDINQALDMHYGKSEGNHGESIEKLVASGDLGEPQCRTDECSSSHDGIVLKEEEHRVDLSLQRSLTEAMAPSNVALPAEKYNPVQHACWRVGEPAPYLHLARTFDLVEAEKGKIRATSMMCNMFRSLLALSPEDVLPAVYLCTNKIAADHENIELNIGGSLVTSALEEACGTNRSKIRDMYNSLGDLGDVAQVFRQTQTLLAPAPPLLIKDVFSALRRISLQTGAGSTVRKKSLIVNLMRSCREKEIKFIVRTLVRNLRIGAMMRTVLPALAQAVAMNSLVSSSDEQKAESLKEKLQYLSAAAVEAYNILPSLDLVVPSLISKGIDFSTATLSMVPGVPIKPMLAKITNGVPQVLKVFQDKAFTCEYKYDGQRAQIHKLPDGSIRVFSRNGDETTSRFPDLITIIEESCKAAAMTFIVDAEVVAIDRKNGYKLMSFQELSSRERGGKDSLITVNKIKVRPLSRFVCLSLISCLLMENNLKSLFCDERKGYFEYAKEMTVEAHDASLTNEVTEAKMKAFLEDALHSSCEGIMVKTLDFKAEYSPSKRTDTWLKVKRDYVEELNDSLDLVPIGAWHGNGRKAGWYSPFLMACYNPETEEFQSVCRVMSGFSDAFYTEMKDYFSGDRVLLKKPPYYRTGEVPDKWFSAELVWEIRGAEFTVSPVHQAAVGLVHPSRGISMRFPRFIGSVSDRNAEECSTAEDIAEMFNSQTRKMDVTTAN
ncbi:DNA ligase 6 isoform X2 [Mercurialis annua]|uniref:DNA ligase 6 isoform X2 n=1 Tax=Mercurialis annua TaxID=3986 RepID=UPI00215FE763|nr:DNA ligase 6 isoform X2 [Mercurialis annua]